MAAIFLRWLLAFVALLTLSMATEDHLFSPAHKLHHRVDIDSVLGPQLSKSASIVHTTANAPRWSDYHAPQPGTVVNVATADDVAKTVAFCAKYKLEFLAQTGSHGWISTFRIGSKDVLINLRGLNTVTIDQNTSIATIGGGTIIQEVVAAADKAGYQIPTGNCNCVGTFGAIGGGGVGHFQGLYGLGVDNVLEMTVVTSDGKIRTINASSGDLWFAFRGAAPNFGIIVSAKMKAYAKADRSVWTGPMIFDSSKIEAITSYIDNLELKAPMSVFLYFVTSGAPSYTPTVLVAPFYAGSTADAKVAFKGLYDLQPLQDNTTQLPYTSANIANDPLCPKGGRKPSYGAGLAKLDGPTWRNIFNLYTDYVKDTRVANSAVFVECYSFELARTLADSTSSYPFRHTIDYTALVNNQYTDPSLDSKAEAFGSNVRSLWRSTSGLPQTSTYINFAFGDEDLQTVYGQNVARLQSIKKKYDSANKFDQWFPLLGKSRRSADGLLDGLEQDLGLDISL